MFDGSVSAKVVKAERGSSEKVSDVCLFTLHPFPSRRIRRASSHLHRNQGDPLGLSGDVERKTADESR